MPPKMDELIHETEALIEEDRAFNERHGDTAWAVATSHRFKAVALLPRLLDALRTHQEHIGEECGRAETIVDDIIHDLQDRRGLRQEWDGIDDDVRREIRERWMEIVLRDQKVKG